MPSQQGIHTWLDDEIFTDYANPRWDLWQGDAVMSNSTRPFLWQEIWGDDWAPEY
jgi:hypothetical protein